MPALSDSGKAQGVWHTTSRYTGCRPCRSSPAAFRVPATDERGERLPGAHPLPHPHPHITASSPAAFATRIVPGPHPTCLAYWLSYNKSKTLMCAPHPLAIGRGPHPSLTLMLIRATTCVLQAETMNDLQARRKYPPHHPQCVSVCSPRAPPPKASAHVARRRAAHTRSFP